MSPDEVESRALPDDGVWRVGVGPDPYEVRPPLTRDELNRPGGNRFDSPLGIYSVVYFATELEACFGESLARFRPDPGLVSLVETEWSSEGFMRPGEVAASWRHARLAVRARCRNTDARFLDVESARTRSTLRKELAPVLGALGLKDLDVPAIRGGDRRLTRMVSYWAWTQVDGDDIPVYSGVRYLSRLNTEWECWGIFDRARTIELERRAITREMTELGAIAGLYRLTIF